MRIAVFDPFCGVSGNMILGAMLDCGLDLQLLEDMLGMLDLKGWKLSVEKVLKNSLQGTYVKVNIPEETSARHLSDILNIISESGLPEWVREKSSTAFRKLAEAESAAHGISIEEVHFHETGAMDAIIDIVGSFCCLFLMEIKRVYASPVATGTGTVTCAHGVLPVPAPATLRLLMGIPTVPSGISTEITTPTGAAVLATAVESWSDPFPPMIAVFTGMGAGTKELSRPNLLRITVGETPGNALWGFDSCIEIKTIMDDMDARIWPDTARRILAAGAYDCYAATCIGKKGRPAIEATVLCPSLKKDDVIECIFRNTTTFGVRISAVERAVLERDFLAVDTEFGPVRLKRAYLDGKLLKTEPEYEDCAKAARVNNVPVREVIKAARCADREIKREG